MRFSVHIAGVATVSQSGRVRVGNKSKSGLFGCSVPFIDGWIFT
jgi:hypothetical protein